MFKVVGSPASWVLSREDKLQDRDTVLYEIDMLRFTHDRMHSLLGGAQKGQEGDLWAYLESFLLHYRNLIEFFGKSSSDLTNLTILRPEVIWPNPKDRPRNAELAKMQEIGERLKQKYEDRKMMDDTISRYLQHCTTFRTGFKEWYIDEMMIDVWELLDLFEKHNPEFKPATYSVSLG
jgi:hypothetical protein